MEIIVNSLAPTTQNLDDFVGMQKVCKELIT